MNSPLLGAVVVESLLACGVTDVVLAPGSRNAPLSLALHAADAAARLRLHVRIDERVAGFLALGLAKGSGRAVAVVTTSGTAVGNLTPAVMEARAAGVPLLLLTADRPSELVGTGANQTTDQVGIFGPAALGVIRLSSTSGTQQAWAAAIQRAHALATGRRTRQPGPVQLNLEFTPPLTGSVPPVAVQLAKLAPSIGAEVLELVGQRPTVVLVGDAEPQLGAEARALAELAGVPLLAEPSSNARCGENAIANYRLLLAGDLGKQLERVICFGHPTLSRPVAALLSRENLELIVVASGANWHDLGSRAAAVVDRVLLEPQDRQWLQRWQQADAELTARRAIATSFDGHAVAAAVLNSMGSDEVLCYGSSQLIRDADLAPISAHPPVCYANRGLAGIDGCLATATGIALATGRPASLLLGDLSLQHDLGALVAPPNEPSANLRVIVGDDNGGAIFASLESGAEEHAAAFERVFATPQSIDLAAIASSLGWRTHTVSDLESLQTVLREPVHGRQLVVAKLDRTERRKGETWLSMLGIDQS